MRIGDAIQAMRCGRYVSREGWNGKGMYLRLVAARPAMREYIELKDAHGYLVPWVCSQSDLLADDWTVLSDQ